MKKSILLLTLSFSFVFTNCSKDETDPDERPDVPKQYELVKAVKWDVGVVHQLEFFYNQDSSINYYLSGSSNLPSKYKTIFAYSQDKLESTRDEGARNAAYSYDNHNRVIQLSQISNGVETSKNAYTYNAEGKIVHVKCWVLINGTLKVSWQSDLTYDASQNIAKTVTEHFDESGNIAETRVRVIEGQSDSVYINPYALLHPLYQHQAHEIFDPVVLATLNRLPKKIKETGRSTGPIEYEYFFSILDGRLDKLKCKTTIDNNPGYFTSEAVFQY
ncbi:hypothetical protein L3C95_18180 [Chitinophaga filiformis]|uniref:hypothetical protein n=1 Tax=Chitinophaga filiformis TaxID=104663 RepID=UPI001F3A54EB|nr:hypothetical protein [Chitinophaga filiformis]MCF6404833.1 hypothetical protein [Chitinophaga filiformis]